MKYGLTVRGAWYRGPDGKRIEFENHGLAKHKGKSIKSAAVSVTAVTPLSKFAGQVWQWWFLIRFNWFVG